ncbi:MAG: hypothetical protein JWO23_1163, partial [Solirubrobacterales bacterium]|nr:hypothetical protein [Solirubrobacterales bacterium]
MTVPRLARRRGLSAAAACVLLAAALGGVSCGKAHSGPPLAVGSTSQLPRYDHSHVAVIV